MTSCSSALGGAWDLPPKADENLSDERLDPLRMKARLLIEGFHSAQIWGWKDPRNSLTLPFWEDLLPGFENTDHRAQSAGGRLLDGKAQRNFVCVWFAAVGNLQPAADRNVKRKERLVTHYDLFFEDAEKGATADRGFHWFARCENDNAADLVAPRKRHTHFTIDQLIDARVSGEVIDLYRALIAEATRRRNEEGRSRHQSLHRRADDLLPGSDQPAQTFVPERIAQIEQLYRELLAQAETRHKIAGRGLTAPSQKSKHVTELATHRSRSTQHYSRARSAAA